MLTALAKRWAGIKKVVVPQIVAGLNVQKADTTGVLSMDKTPWCWLRLVLIWHD
jgi:hypothetical protein